METPYQTAAKLFKNKNEPLIFPWEAAKNWTINMPQILQEVAEGCWRPPVVPDKPLEGRYLHLLFLEWVAEGRPLPKSLLEGVDLKELVESSARWLLDLDLAPEYQLPECERLEAILWWVRLREGERLHALGWGLLQSQTQRPVQKALFWGCSGQKASFWSGGYFNANVKSPPTGATEKEVEQ